MSKVLVTSFMDWVRKSAISMGRQVPKMMDSLYEDGILMRLKKQYPMIEREITEEEINLEGVFNDKEGK